MKFLKKIQLNIIVAEPMNVSPTEFGFTDDKVNHKRYLDFSKRKSKKLVHAFSPDVGLYRFSEHYIVLNDTEQSIVYFMQFKVRRILGRKLVTQVILWNDRLMDKEKFNINGQSIAVYVFFECLMGEADGVGIATDSMQTPDGRRFWEGRVARAFSRGLHVYLIDQNTHTEVEIHDAKEFKAKTHSTWSEVSSSMAKRIVISLKALW